MGVRPQRETWRPKSSPLSSGGCLGGSSSLSAAPPALTPPIPPPRETVARLQQENQRLQAQEAALRVQRDRLQQQLRDIDRYGGDRGGGPNHPPPQVPISSALTPPVAAP